MRTIWMKRAGWVLVLGLGLAGVAWFAWPQPIAVDLAIVTKGPMEVTVDDEAKTNVRHIYTVYAPVAGKVLRISHPSGNHEVSRHVGDGVIANETVVAVMQPAPSSFIGARTRRELQAAAAAADAAITLAEAEIRRIEAALEFAHSELGRTEALARTNAVSIRTLERSRLDFQTNEAALASAKAQLDVRRGERAGIAARLLGPTSTTPQLNPHCCVQIRSPATGRILKIIQDSEASVQPGAPLMNIGDPLDLEVIADLLSSDVVRIKVGAPVRIDGWGGPPLQGRVTRVDPAGFLKVSALGIEEQRVRTTIDLVDPPAAWSLLGHDYRVIVHVTVWSADDAVTVPVGALFRAGDNWAVFAVADGRARTTLVRIGHRNNRVAEVLSGVSVGDRVILHASDRIKDGIRVAERR